MKSLRVTGIAAALLLGAVAVAFAKPVTFKPPAETSTLKATSAPGAQNAANLCGICHSRDYITSQPRGKGKDFWTAEVTKMVNVYGAPIAEPDRAAIIDYLAQTY